MIRSARQFARASKIAIFGFVLMLPIFMTPSNPAFAGATLSLSPSGGNYTSQFQVNVNVAITGDPIYAFDLDIDYTGPIDFVSGSAGTAGCSPIIQESTQGTVTIVCLALQPLTNGSLATLTFAPTGTGSSTMTIEVVDSDGTIDGVSGGSYTIQSGGGTGGGSLPTTAIGSQYFALMGGALLASGSFLYLTSVNPERLLKYLYKEDSEIPLKEKIK